MSPSENSDTTGTAQIGVTGLAVMGSNIARNFAHHGYTVALHNRSIAKTDALLAEHGSEGKFVRSETIGEFLAALEKPRRVLIMVKAGDPTDAVINELADDAAVRAAGPTPLARALVACASGRTPSGALAAGGPTTVLRVRRLCGRPNSRAVAATAYLAAAAVLVVPTLALAVPWLTELHRLFIA